MSPRRLIFLVLSFIAFNPSNAKQEQPFSINIDNFLDKIYLWGGEAQSQILISGPLVLAGVLCFIASAISSAGGIGGGGLFIPILSIVAGLDLKTASSLSAFMVTGGSIANVMCNMCITSLKFGGKSLIDYDIALSSEPCMLLGVSLGVICNLVFPEWLITVLFAIFLAWSTSKTCRSGLMLWKSESDQIKKIGVDELEKGLLENETVEERKVLAVGHVYKENNEPKDVEVPVPLLSSQGNRKVRIPWLKLMVLLLIWFSFFSVYLLRGNRYGQGVIEMEPCGVGYWILSSVQIPLAVVFTAWIVFRKESLRDRTPMQEITDVKVTAITKNRPSNILLFPSMALLAGILGGVFGIGGGMLISPLLLQVGIKPEVTAATCSFMVLFSATMSALQYLLLGMEHVEAALILAIMCFVASLLGLLVVQRVIRKYGRASIIVFSVSVVMFVSNVLMTSFGAIKVWTDYESREYMGFKLPC
ncbi:sulfite exporter TauE/SafE family protein 2-like isoform X1 [Vigna umbellata]|uniref:sulfite exporter TauE/SafE family protein 2-like isoform X1 n=1 Tax=Vigna umbellata TaxID=87088 RepID=UPI001F5EBB81|nr:sulfite exporter TauE/SafE family protein 2-like isoform X1 [Vigna umbellata]